MSDRAAVLVALAAVLGALWGHGPSPWLAASVVAVAFVVRRPWLLAVGVLVLAGGLAERAQAGLVPPAPGPFQGWVTLLTDVEAAPSGVRADVRLSDGRHVQVEAAGGAVEALRVTQAGDRVRVLGRLRAPPPGATWLEARHVAGVLAVDEVRERAPGAPWMQAANAVRGLLVRGAQALPARDRPLFLGFVLGDTRGQAPDITDDFRGAGLSHLLAVSGQNVAFVLALAGPLLRRVGLRARLPATIAVIVFFALVTRFEPSVLRASVMAALTVTAATMGREASSLRLLAFAVTGLLLLDPFLVRSVGFQLSAGACAGIVVLSPSIRRSLPLPRSLAEPLSVTLAAQAGVAPVLVVVFGGVPVAGIPANVLAAPVAGPVMIWGLSAGMLAGAIGGRFAAVAHWPTHVMIGWIEAVAHRAALLPLGEVRGRELAAVAVGAVVVAVAARLTYTGVRRVGLAMMAVALAAPAVALRAVPPVRVPIGAGATLWRAGGSVLELDGRVEVEALLEGLRRAGVTQLDVVAARSANAGVRTALDSLRRRYDIGRVVLPSNTRSATSLEVGDLRVDARPAGDRLIIDIALAPTGRARGPPV